MQKSFDYIPIDINTGKVRKSVSVCRSDTIARTLTFTLSDSGKPIDMSDVVWAEILIHKADGYEVDNGCVIVGSEIQYTLRSNDIAAVGTNTAQLLVTFSDQSQVTTPTFEIVVYEKVLDPNVQTSFSEYTSIAQQLVLCKEYAKECQDTLNEIEDVGNVSANMEDIIALAESLEDVSTVADNILSVNAVAPGIANVNAVVQAINDVTNVASNISYIQDVGRDISQIESIYSNLEDINSLVENMTDINNVADDLTAIETVASDHVINDYLYQHRTDIIAGADAAVQAQSYAKGGTGQRTGEDTDNAKYYYEQAFAVSQSLSGALKPAGSYTFANVPANAQVGEMFNITDAFTTTADFREGAGLQVAAGANIYLAEDNKWDILAGVIVTGVKGAEESTYMTGNVSITPADIGSPTTANFNSLVSRVASLEARIGYPGTM